METASCRAALLAATMLVATSASAGAADARFDRIATWRSMPPCPGRRSRIPDLGRDHHRHGDRMQLIFTGSAGRRIGFVDLADQTVVAR